MPQGRSELESDLLRVLSSLLPTFLSVSIIQ